MLGSAPLVLFRLASWFYQHGLKPIANLITFLNRILFACFIGPGATIGKGVSLGYGGLGVVIHQNAVVGDFVRIGTGVTIGGRSKIIEVPTIGNYCVIGSGAKILGPIQLGERVVVGANSVVLNSVDADSVVAGIPGKVIKTGINIADFHDGLTSQ